jgi:hypothetical protein
MARYMLLSNIPPKPMQILNDSGGPIEPPGGGGPGRLPGTRESGTMKGMRCIGGGRPEVRLALYMAALSAARCNPILRTLYKHLRAKGKLPKVALTAVMRRLLTYMNHRRRVARVAVKLRGQIRFLPVQNMSRSGQRVILPTICHISTSRSAPMGDLVSLFRVLVSAAQQNWPEVRTMTVMVPGRLPMCHQL